jgi:lysozyme
MTARVADRARDAGLAVLILAAAGGHAAAADAAAPARPDGAFGIDISDHQGAIDWTALPADEVGYIFIRATYGTHVDDDFVAYWQHAGALHIPRGIYHFYRNGEHPVDQAATLIGALQMAGGFAAGDLVPVVDVENNARYDPPLTDAADTQSYVADLCTFVGAVEQVLGVRPIIYTSASYWQQLGAPDGFEHHPLWVAEYGVAAPNLPTGWDHYDIWQYGTATVAGITTAVDGNVSHPAVADLAKLGRDAVPAGERCGGAG